MFYEFTGARPRSPPLRRVEWDADVEPAIEHYYDALKEIVAMEARLDGR